MRAKNVVSMIFVFLIALVGRSYAQSVTIVPNNPSMVVNTTAQFTAQVTGLPSTAVTWSVASKGGGNSIVGTITPNGAYTAPANPPAQNPVQIAAISAVDHLTTGYCYVYLLTQGPAITSVSPNPIPVGNLTVTIQGSGFQPGAEVFDTYGSNPAIQLSTGSITPSSITANGYQGPGASASFCVKNPGSICGNTISVPIGSQRKRTPTPIPTATTQPDSSPTPSAGATPLPTQSAVASTSATMAPTVAATPAATPAPIPFPVSGHPRLWITQNDLPRLQSWATSNNPVYQNGLLPVLNKAVQLYQTQFFPGGMPNPNYPDPGDTQGYTGDLTEEYGLILAFNSLIDPKPSNRILYAQYARNMVMYAMNQAALGTLSGAPFRDRLFATYNRASLSGEAWPLIVDWIYNDVDGLGNPILTASDKATIRNVFMMWANACESASTTGGDSPPIQGLTNSTLLLPNLQPYRFAANNYYTAHARLMTMMALAIDPGDDPAVDPTQSAAMLGNSIRSYLSDALGAWLYEQFAMYLDGPTVVGAYGIPGSGAGFGLASGGLPPEGMLYGISYANLLQGLLALQTAGFNNPAYASYTGPQIGLISAPMWDRFIQGTFSSLIPAPFAPTQPGETYLGQVYEFASYGDLLRFYVTPDYVRPFATLALLEQENGLSTHVTDARWFSYNVLQGGPTAFYTRITDPYSLLDTILYYMLYDPAISPASAPDPRPGYPNLFLDQGAGRLVAHTNWSAAGTMFDYRASWESINHQDGNAGQFELYRSGEWLTKELSNYDNNGFGLTTYYHNTLALQNTCSNCNPQNTVEWWELGELANGSQWMIGQNGGDPVTHFSSGAAYVFADTDMTKLYNRPNLWTPGNSFNNITQATRSILWLNGDYIVIYDRATSHSANLFKRWNLTLITNPAVTGNVATETLPSGQQLFIQSLLPVNSTVTSRYAAGDLTTVAELEPSRYVMTVQDASNPTDTRFLHVLQGADAGVAMVPASYRQSTTGTQYDGAVFGSTAVYFPVSVNGSFNGATLPAPAGVHTVMVAGLVPNSSYNATVNFGPAGTAIVVHPGAGLTTDSAGLLTVTF